MSANPLLSFRVNSILHGAERSIYFKELWKILDSLLVNQGRSETFLFADMALRIEGLVSNATEAVFTALSDSLWGAGIAELQKPALTIKILDKDSIKYGDELFRSLSGCSMQNRRLYEPYGVSSVSVGIEEDGRVVSLYDRDSQRALVVADFGKLAEDTWYLAAPFRFVFEEFAHGNALFLVHAGAVSIGESSTGSVATLFIGPSGQGKSTTVAACAVYGMPILGDDYVIIKKIGSDFSVFPIYRTIKTSFEFHGLRLFSVPLTRPCQQDKNIYTVGQGGQLDLSRPHIIKAIVLPIVKMTEAVKLEAVDKFTVLKKFLPSTILQSHTGHHAQAGMINSLVAKSSCFQLSINPNLDDVGGAVASLCQTLLN